MKIVQQVGGSAPNQDAFTGPERELTVDTDNWDLRLHDGVTPGGHRILQRDNADARYQPRSVELDGFAFAASLRGYVTRLGPGVYRIRQITVDGRQLTIANADGFNGNPLVGLASEITTPHTFTSGLQVESGLTVVGGITGNLTGNTTGTHTGPVIGNVTGDLTGNASGNHTGTFTGDVDVRGKTVQFDSGQIPLAALDGLLDYIKSNAEDIGVIKIWSGAIVDIPTRWALCNGLNGTPDLTDKFVIGAGSISLDPGDQGGTSSHIHNNTVVSGGAHTHTAAAAGHALTLTEMPAHRHANGVTDTGAGDVFSRGTTSSPGSPDSIDNNGSSGTLEGWTETVGGGAAHSHDVTIDAGGSHSHDLNNVAASTLPPYYALAYIMKIA